MKYHEQTCSAGGPSELSPALCSAVRNLVEAAQDLLTNGGSVTRRAALREAIKGIDFASGINGAVEKSWQFTPAAKWVLCRAAKLASIQRDECIRTAYLETALLEQQNDKLTDAGQQKP